MYDTFIMRHRHLTKSHRLSTVNSQSPFEMSAGSKLHFITNPFLFWRVVDLRLQHSAIVEEQSSNLNVFVLKHE